MKIYEIQARDAQLSEIPLAGANPCGGAEK